MSQLESELKQTEANTSVQKDDTVWRISEFAKKISKHINTVDNWFKQLESSEVHYINRLPNGEKVYDTLDLKIGLFIKQKREEKWSLDAIFDQLPARYPCRDFPEPQDLSQKSSEIMDLDDLTRKIKAEVSAYIEENLEPFTAQLANLDKYIQDTVSAKIEEQVKVLQLEMLQSLPQPAEEQQKMIEEQIKKQFELAKTEIAASIPQQTEVTEEQQRSQRIEDVLLLQKIRVELEQEALNEWLKKPEQERFQQVGFLFKKQIEDVAAKQSFINDYVNKRFEERLKILI
ncbi:hypothetical protein ACFQZ1_08820 [Bacillus sp. CGMCC 1.60114]|uniref:hypothetical protein n=1 Tax=unclassified Bacillus (in: firmicutes) TaxID=185979 RepID=UPI00362A04A6